MFFVGLFICYIRLLEILYPVFGSHKSTKLVFVTHTSPPKKERNIERFLIGASSQEENNLEAQVKGKGSKVVSCEISGEIETDSGHCPFWAIKPGPCKCMVILRDSPYNSA